jgi:hypothetical protein
VRALCSRRRILVFGFERDGLAVELLDRSRELVASTPFRALIPFIAIDVVVESRTFGSVRTVRAIAAHRPFQPFARTAYVALRTSKAIGLDSVRAAQAGVDDLDVAVVAVKRVAIGSWR